MAGKKAVDVVKDLAITIYDRLVQLGISKRSLRAIRVLYILRQEPRSARKVAKVLERGRREGYVR